MVDLLGPGDAGASPTLSTTTDVTAPVGGDTWHEDCVSGMAGSGTPVVSKWLNRINQQLRAAIRASNVPVSNAYDNMLSWAMQSGFVNWLQTGFGGAPNALTGSANNSPLAIEGGTVVCGLVTTPTNTGATTFNWSGLGVEPLLQIDGAACAGGEVQNGAFLVVRWDGGAWRIVSSYTKAQIQSIVNQANPFTTTGVGAVIIASSVSLYDPSPALVGVGDTSSWYAGGSDPRVYRIGIPNCYASDARWPSSPPPGTWELLTISRLNSTDYTSFGGGTPPCIATWGRVA